MRAATSGASSSGLHSISLNDDRSALELSAVVSRYRTLWANPEPSTTTLVEEVQSTEKPTTISNLIPLSRFLHSHDMAPRVHSPLSESEQPAAKRTAFEPPDPLRCEQCDVNATSQEHLDTHMRGAKHARRMQLVSSDNAVREQYGLENPMIIRMDFAKWRCMPCNAEMCSSAVDTHMQGARHRSKLKMWNNPRGNNAENYVCSRCNIACSSESSFNAHLASVSHRRIHAAAAATKRAGERVDIAHILSMPRSPRHLQFTQTANPEVHRPHTTSSSPSPGAPASPRTPLNASAKEFRPSRLSPGGALSPGVTTWRHASSSPTMVTGSDTTNWRASTRPVPASVRPKKRGDKTPARQYPCSTCPVVCNSQQTFNDHLSSQKHERAVKAARENEARQAARVGSISVLARPTSNSTVRGTPIADGTPVASQSPADTARASAPMDVDSPLVTPTAAKQQQPVAPVVVPPLTLFKMSSFEIAPTAKEGAGKEVAAKRAIEKAVETGTPGKTSSLEFVPASRAFAINVVHTGAIATKLDTEQVEKDGKYNAPNAIEIPQDDPLSERASAGNPEMAVDNVSKTTKDEVLTKETAGFALTRVESENGDKAQDSTEATGEVENVHMSEVPQPVPVPLPEAMNVTSAHAEGGDGQNEGRSAMDLRCGVGEAMWRTATSPLPDAEPTMSTEELEEGEVDEKAVPANAVHKAAAVPMEDVTAAKLQESAPAPDKPVEQEVQANVSNVDQSPEIAVESNLDMGSKIHTGSAVEENRALDFSSPGALSTTAQSLVSRTKGKKNKGRTSGRSPTPEKDLGQWFCAVCSVQCNAKAPFQDHLQSVKHIRLLQVPKTGEGEGSLSGRALSPQLAAGKRKNSPPRKKKKKADTPMEYTCDVCKITCNSEIPFQEHLASSKHIRKLAAEAAAVHGSSGLAPFEPSFLMTPSLPVPAIADPTNATVMTCEVCNVSCSGKDNYDAHIRGKPHAKRLRNFVGSGN